MSAIAARNHTTVAALAAANGISDPNLIFAGARLIVPPSSAGRDGATAPASPSATAAATQAGGQTNGAPQGAELVSYTVAAPSDSSGTSSSGASLPAQLLAHPARLALRPAFFKAASTYGVPANVLQALCWWESGWQTDVVSATGAIGVCQVEPYTVDFINSSLLGGSKLDPHDAASNIDLSAAYLRYLISLAGGNVAEALAGYYQGMASVQQYGEMSFTQLYVQGILAFANDFTSRG